MKNNSLPLPKVETTLYGIGTIMFIGKKFWQTLQIQIEELQSPEIFKQKLKQLKTLIAVVDYAKLLFQA